MQVHNPLEAQVGGAIEQCHNFRQTAWFLWRQTHKPGFNKDSQAGQVLELCSQLIESEYYESLKHLQVCLKALMTEAPSVEKVRALFDLEWSRVPTAPSSGSSTEMQETSPSGNSTEIPS